METIILFVTHWQITENGNLILKELLNYWDVYALIDEKQNTRVKWVKYKQYKNEWYDFGKIYQFLLEYKWKLDELIYTNDTISIIDSFKGLFDWWDKSDLDMWWATSALSCHNFGNYGYHIQSFFHFFRWEAVESVKAKYMMTGILEDKEAWVKTFETGFTNYMECRWYKCWAFIEIDKIANKYWWERINAGLYGDQWIKQYDRYGELNGTFDYPLEYMKEWLPFIKNSCFQYHMYNPNLLPNLCNIAWKFSV